jgi:tRNA (uracil-5-)-methyltransferase TRM9
MIEEARKLHPEYDFRVCDMLAFSDNDTFKQRNYDALLFLASFHHLARREERLRVLLDAKKLLSPRGRIYMTNWNLLGQERYTKNHRWDGEFDIKIGAHSRYYHGFTIPELESLFLEAGYSIILNQVFEGGRNIVSVLK